MRRIFVAVALVAIISAATVVVKLGEASAQPPAIEVASPPATYQVAAPPAAVGPPGGAGHTAYVFRQPVESGDDESKEMASLQGEEARSAQEAESLSRQLSAVADEKQRTDIKSKLQETLGKQFDAQQKMRYLEVTKIEAKLKKLRELITKRNDARKTIIDKRFEQLLRESEGLGWNSPTPYSQETPRALYGTSYLPQPAGHFAPLRVPVVRGR